MKKQRIFTLFILIVMIVSMLSGCKKTDVREREETSNPKGSTGVDDKDESAVQVSSEDEQRTTAIIDLYHSYCEGEIDLAEWTKQIAPIVEEIDNVGLKKLILQLMEKAPIVTLFNTTEDADQVVDAIEHYLDGITETIIETDELSVQKEEVEPVEVAFYSNVSTSDHFLINLEKIVVVEEDGEMGVYAYVKNTSTQTIGTYQFEGTLYLDDYQEGMFFFGGEGLAPGISAKEKLAFKIDDEYLYYDHLFKKSYLDQKVTFAIIKAFCGTEKYYHTSDLGSVHYNPYILFQ